MSFSLHDIIPSALNITVDGNKIKGRSKKIWIDCMKDDTHKKRVSTEMMVDRQECNKKTSCADHTYY